ncbi:glycosyltransferase family A protein [Lachnospiraceae bacterium KK002]
MSRNRDGFGTDIEAVITSFNQGTMILEAVESVCAQTLLPQKIIIIDDGSTDECSIRVLKDIEKKSDLPVPVMIHYQENGGVSSARNAGIKKAQAPMVLVLDGDDRLKPEYTEYVSRLLRDNPSMVAASSWMHTFGVLDSVVCPSGGNINSFLSRNCCPATHILRRDIFEQCGGYDESMRSGFEDWDFFLSMLETSPESWIGIVDKPLIQYRTTPVSSNIKSMDKRLELMGFIIEKHVGSYHTHISDALLGIEAISDLRLYNWENEVAHAIANHRELSQSSKDFLNNPTYGDGGMASAVRIAGLWENSR